MEQAIVISGREFYFIISSSTCIFILAHQVRRSQQITDYSTYSFDSCKLRTIGGYSTKNKPTAVEKRVAIYGIHTYVC